MRAFVMAAGRGTRLAPLTDILPKPTLPVGNEPVMGHLLRLLARNGVRHVTSNIAYLADRMEAVFGDGTPWGVELTWSREPELLGTAGGMRFAEGTLLDGDEPVLVLSGDGLHDVDIAALVARHRDAGALATIALTHVDQADQYGVAVVDEDGWIGGFQEKPAPGTELSNLANTGIYVFSREVFDLLPPAGKFHDFGDDLFPELVRLAAGDGRQRLLGVAVDGYWNDIGGLEAFRQGSLALLDGQLDILVRHEQDGGSWGDQVLVHHTARIDANVTFVGPCIVGPHASIGHDAHIAHSVVLPGARVPEGALVVAATFGDVDGLRRWADELAAPIGSIHAG